MRHHLAAGVILVLALSASHAQQAPPVLNTLTAMNHVGEVATVCGQVADSVCRRGPDYVTLTLAPSDQPSTVRIAVRAEDPQSSENPDDRFFGRRVCVQGTIEKVVGGLQIAVADPTHVETQQQERVLPPFGLDAYSACDPNVVLPAELRSVKPQYTARAMRARVGGAVKMRAVVDTDGRVRDVQLMRSVHPDLDEVAIQALRQWVFRPGTYMGKPVPVIVVVDMAFSLR